MNLEGAGNSITSGEWNPIHCLLVTSSKDMAQAIKLWDPRTGGEIHTMYVFYFNLLIIIILF